MAQALVKNNAYSTLAADISSGATSITVAVGHGARFPTVSGGNFFYATLINASNVLEIVKVVGRSGDILTVTRGQDGTTGTAYLLGDRIELRPTAGLFDDKLSLGGGILTGPLSVPAGATTTQAPQIQEVVKRAGDTMTGALIVPEVTVGILKGSSGLIDLPTGHRILAADVGALVAPGMVIQTAHLLVDTSSTFSYTAAAGNAVSNMDISALNITFTPKFATSKVLLKYMVSGDANVDNFMFALRRNGTLIGQNAGGTDRWYGTVNIGNPAGSSVPETWSFFLLDSPASVAALTYKLQFQVTQSGAVAATFYLNRAAAFAPQSQYEGGISQVLIQEIAQ
jgi:hypothetical protein